jgi:cobalt-zinc-cadmium resistance protein CzcA
MAQPISDRVDEMVTGVRPTSRSRYSATTSTCCATRRPTNRARGAHRAGCGNAIERVTGQQYLTIEIDRPTIARHGINVADVRT